MTPRRNQAAEPAVQCRHAHQLFRKLLTNIGNLPYFDILIPVEDLPSFLRTPGRAGNIMYLITERQSLFYNEIIFKRICFLLLVEVTT